MPATPASPPAPTVPPVPKAGERQATIPVGDQPADLAFGEEAIWVANAGSGTVTRIDPQTNTVVAEITSAKEVETLALRSRWQ
ncbi:MAG TPA: hypothetical protein VK900_05165 [Anaerolineales bacterium]|nr:hypothetical protein [Anaerolineales bacterium]